MSWIFEIGFQLPENQDANQDVLMWHAFSVKAVTAGYERSLHDKSLQKPSLVKLCITVFNSSKINQNNHYEPLKTLMKVSCYFTHSYNKWMENGMINGQ